MKKSPIFRSIIKEFTIKSVPGTDFDGMQPAVRSKYMTRAYISEIVRKLSPGLLPDVDEDIEPYITDMKDDCGVDFIYRSEGCVLVIQAKYHGPEKQEKESEFSHFCEVLERLNDQTLTKNEKLDEVIADVDWDNDTFDLRFITLGKINDGIRSREDRGITSKILRDVDSRSEIRCIDESGLNQEYRDALSAEQGIAEDIVIPFSKNVSTDKKWVEYEADKRRSFVGLINGSQIAQLAKQYKTRLFNLNIRNYIGDTSTNKAIIKTAEESPEKFFFFNNGISAVATGITVDEEAGSIRCRQFSIVNGAQTAKSIAKAHRKNPEAVRKVDVLLRITEMNLKEADFISQTTKFNNTQNSVKVSDFRSNDAIQLSIAKQFSDLSRGGVKFLYRNKRTERETGCISVGMEEFIKTIHSFLHGPPDCFGGNGYMFDTGNTGGYFKLFKDGTQSLDPSEFRRLAGVWILCEAVHNYTKNYKKDIQKSPDLALAKNALERRWLVFAAVGELLRHLYRNDESQLNLDLVAYARPDYARESGAVKIIDELAETVCATLVFLYQQEAGKKEFKHRNWFRDPKTIEKIHNYIEHNPALKKLPRLRKVEPKK